MLCELYEAFRRLRARLREFQTNKSSAYRQIIVDFSFWVCFSFFQETDTLYLKFQPLIVL